jgi:alkylation response protein AidB-like acyl-CoA dehydrogenase
LEAWPGAPGASARNLTLVSGHGYDPGVQLHYDEETEAFRSELRAFLEANLPPPEERSEPVRSSAHIPDWARRWQRLLFDNGWLVPGWPPEYGGRNATPVQQMVYFEELVRLGVPRSCNPQGLSIITPSILDFGTEEQKLRYALPTLRAEVAWCLGMSEPNAGSDLAGLRTRAELHGDRFVVNGQKVWTSGAHDADYCFCFVRTDPEAPKHAGISVLVIDMRTPGIETRPLPELTDKDVADFNEVFFTDVEVPAENLVGQLHHGWSIAGGSLAHERGMLWISEATNLERMIERAVTTATTPLPGGKRLADDPMFRDTLARAYVQSQALKLLGYRGFAKFAKGMQSPEHSVLKLLGSEVRRALAGDVGEALGLAGLDVERKDAPAQRADGEAWLVQWMHAFSNTIAGGTSEIQRNIIAERVLGLPRR